MIAIIIDGDSHKSNGWQMNSTRPLDRIHPSPPPPPPDPSREGEQQCARSGSGVHAQSIHLIIVVDDGGGHQ